MWKCICNLHCITINWRGENSVANDIITSRHLWKNEEAQTLLLRDCCNINTTANLSVRYAKTSHKSQPDARETLMNDLLNTL